MKLTTLLDGLAELLFPPRCVACAALVPPGAAFCAPCAVATEPLGAACPRCALPIAGGGGTCLGCAATPPPWERAHAVLIYGGSTATAVRRYKAGAPELARPLGALLEPLLAALPAESVLVPVPLHPRRLRQREFNQASLLARVARRRRPHLTVGEWLDRRRDTPPQSSLAARARRDNVRGAFRVRPGAPVAGRTVVLVDDVLTTGATLGECAAVLQRSKAARVEVLVLARAVA